MKITKGKAKGHKLSSSVTKNLDPILSVTREPVLDVVADKIIGAKVLDLFAGTGSLGIETLSRGADSCNFVEIDRDACKNIEKNLKHSHFHGKKKVFHTDVMEFLSKNFEKYDLVFIDPPKHYQNFILLLHALTKNLHAKSTIILHVPLLFSSSILTKFNIFEQKKFGQYKFLYLNPK